jgi:hypothetical protein
MADNSWRYTILGHIRRWPLFYKILKSFWNLGPDSVREILRATSSSFRFGAAKGFFSGLKKIETGEVVGRLVIKGQSLPSLPDRSIISICGMNQAGRQPWPVFWVRMSDIRLVGPSLAVMDKKKRLMVESVYGEEFCFQSPSYNYIYLNRPVMLTGTWTSIVGDISRGYYHWFMDVLPRLALLKEFPSHIKIIARGPLKKFQIESLDMLGLRDRVRETFENHLVVEDFYFSSPSAMTGCCDPRGIAWSRSVFLDKADTTNTPKKIFIIRKGKTRGIRNLEEVIAFFQLEGWAVIDTEELTFAGQIALFKNAEIIVAEHGAALTNLLWCRPGCKVLELFSHNYLNGCYEAIALCLGLSYRFEIFEADSEHRFNLDTLKLMKLLSAEFGYAA